MSIVESEHTIQAARSPFTVQTVGEEWGDYSGDDLLYRLVSARSGLSREDWEAMRLRRSLCAGAWRHSEAAQWTSPMREQLVGKTVIFLGSRVGALFNCGPFLSYEVPGEDWLTIPTTGYDSRVQRAIVEILLADIVWEMQNAAQDTDNGVRRVHRPAHGEGDQGSRA